MIINCRGNRGWGPGSPGYGKRCLLDGVDVTDQTHYVDTEAGIVKTYNVFGDGKPHLAGEQLPPVPDGIEIEDLGFGLLSRTLRGKVELVD